MGRRAEGRLHRMDAGAVLAVSEDAVPGDVRRWDEDGEPIMVVRPARPDVVLSLAKIALAHDNPEALAAAYEGPLVFKGYLVKRRGKFLCVDGQGLNPVELEPGDLFTAPSDARLVNQS
jgi:hypothetical protein